MKSKPWLFDELPREQKFGLEIFPHAEKRSVETGKIQAKSATRKYALVENLILSSGVSSTKNMPKLKNPFNFGRWCVY